MKQYVGLSFGFVAAVSLLGCTAEGLGEAPGTSSRTQSVASPPNDPAAIAEADAVADVMISRLFAALLQEFAETTADNAEVNSKAISNIFFDTNYTMRLVGEVEPLQENNRPQDDFERVALDAAMQGSAYSAVDHNRGWWVRKSVPVGTFTPACAHCHDNFPANETQLVGALMVRARIGD